MKSGEGGSKVLVFFFSFFFFVLFVKFLLLFFTLATGGDVGLFFIFHFFITLFILNIFWVFFSLLERRKGHKFFFNLLRGQGIGLIFLFWEKNGPKMEKEYGLNVGFIFFKVVIIRGERGRGLYFFISFILLMVVIFCYLAKVLGVWKGMPYTERLCRGCNLGKVEDQEHLLLVCPSTQKVKERFCSTLCLTHISTFDELMQTTNTVALAKFVACYQYQRIICPP